MSTAVWVGKRGIGSGHPCFVIAEAGVNHNGSLELALQLVDIAAEAGADAVKFQTFKAAKLATAAAEQADYQKRNGVRPQSQLEMLRELELGEAEHLEIMRRCRERDIEFMSTPFDEESADFLDAAGMRIIKIPSGEVTNLALVQHLAAKQKPILLSTGMCYLSDVEACVRTLEQAGVQQMAILHCVSNYPADPADTNLRAMQTLEHAFGYPVGYSDHTLGIEVPLAAAARGACVVEKHFTLDRGLPGPDHRASAEPGELKRLVAGIRTVEAALGTGRKAPVPAELNTAAVARRSLVAARSIPAGQQICREDLVGRRPGTGLPPSMIDHLVGRTAREAIAEGALISLAMVS